MVGGRGYCYRRPLLFLWATVCGQRLCSPWYHYYWTREIRETIAPERLERKEPGNLSYPVPIGNHVSSRVEEIECTVKQCPGKFPADGTAHCRPFQPELTVTPAAFLSPTTFPKRRHFSRFCAAMSRSRSRPEPDAWLRPLIHFSVGDQTPSLLPFLPRSQHHYFNTFARGHLWHSCAGEVQFYLFDIILEWAESSWVP